MSISYHSSAFGLNQDFLRILKRFFDEIYVPAFPNPDIRESFESLLRYNDPEHFGDSEPHGFIILAVAEGPSGPTPVGGALYEVYHSCRAALLTYIVVHLDKHSQGLGTALFNEVLNGLGRLDDFGEHGPLLFAETKLRNDDSDSSAAELTRKRISFLSKLGFLGLDFNYLMPPLSPELNYISDLQLLIFKKCLQPDATAMPVEHVAAFLQAFYAAIVGDRLPRDKRLQDSLAQLRRLRAVGLTPVGQGPLLPA